MTTPGVTKTDEGGSLTVTDYTVIAAVSVAWPVYRHKPEDEAKNAATVMAAAGEISKLMGYEAI